MPATEPAAPRTTPGAPAGAARGGSVPTGRLAADVLRALTATAVQVSAAIHLVLWVEGMHRVDVVGPLFLLNAVGGVALGVAVLAWRHWIPLLGALAFGVLTLVPAVLATLPDGFMGVRESWSNPVFLVSGVADVLAAALAVAAWWVGLRAPRR